MCVSRNGAYYGVPCEIDLEMDVHFILQDKSYITGLSFFQNHHLPDSKNFEILWSAYIK